MENYKEYKKEQLVELLEYIDSPVETFGQACIKLCEALSCENCPVTINNCDYRTQEDRILYHEPCHGQLYNWMIKEAKKETKCEQKI